MKMKNLAIVLIAILSVTACNDMKSNKEPITVVESCQENITIETTTISDFKHADGLSDKYVDFNNMSFVFNGRLMTIGVSTLQDFIDAGAEFSEVYDYNALWNAELYGQVEFDAFECSIKSNSQMPTAFKFANRTNSPIPMRECVLCYIRYFDFEKDRQNSGYSNIEFSFPCTLTWDELTANSGEPDEKLPGGYGYTIFSSKYNNYKNGVRFSFAYDTRDNSCLGIIGYNITWLP